MLTQKQKELLLLIRDRLAADGVPPSFDEMKDALGLKSKSGIHRLITGLEERGFIKRLPHRARALEIVRMPEGMEAKKQARKAKLPSAMPDMAAIAHSISLPLYGRIAAGAAIEAIQMDGTNIDVPIAMISGARGRINPNELYALEVNGDSMIEAGILDGDHVVIKRCDSADDGSIVVALIEDSDATLKKLERRGSQIALIPANRNYETRVLPSSQVKVQGKLVGLVRKY